jgi:hypothetical protein
MAELAKDKVGELAETSENKIMKLITEGKNPRGIPSAKFIEDVEIFLLDCSVEPALGALSELYSKYKYMETSFDRSKNIYKTKVPEIEQTLEIIRHMKARKEEDEEMHANYSLCDTIYARAKLDLDAGKVCLWIGASKFKKILYYNYYIYLIYN